MDHRRFDSITKQLGSGSSRRSVLKGLLGVGGIAATGLVIHGQTEAARRGFSGPTFPSLHTPTPTPAPTPTCIANGDPCDIFDPAGCCSQCCMRVGQTETFVCCS